MDIPPNVFIPICIEQGAVYFYHLDIINRDGSSYSGDRFFVILNANPKTDEVLILSTITTKIEHQRDFIKRTGEDPSTLVEISPRDFPPLHARSAVNCNTIYQMSLSDLIAKVEAGGKTFTAKLPKVIIASIVGRSLKSRQISPEIKQLLI